MIDLQQEKSSLPEAGEFSIFVFLIKKHFLCQSTK